jgi:L-ascorbate metabolism protein UlaG (beta-lactamase superfamily)
MTEPVYHLKPNIKFEPLVAKWYAWPHLFAPAPAALNLQRRYLDIMRKYVKAPQVHAAAVKNPALKGGPFIDLPMEHVGKVEQLLKETETNNADLLGLADALTSCQTLLRSRAKGGSLEGLYREVPPALRGYVELVYDISNSAGIRLIEPLLYRSKYFKKSLQSVMLSPMETDYRPFILSTPRFVLDEASEMEWHVSFDDERIDYFAGLRETPRPMGEIVERLGLDSTDTSKVKTFLTEKAPTLRDDRRYRGSGLRIRYFGHACLLVETADVAILVDPFLSYQYPSEVERFSVMDLPETIDYVLLTHGHADHMSFEWLLQLRSRVKHIVFPQNDGGFLPDPSLRLMLNQIGFKWTIGLEELNHIDIPGGQVTAIPFLGEHGDLNIRSKTAYLINLKGKQIVLAADSCNLEPALYEHVRGEHGPVDMLFLGMECDGAPVSWIYGPCVIDSVSREFDQERRLNGSNRERAWNIVKALECKEVYTYAMGMEPWLGHIMALSYTAESPQILESDKLLNECRNAGIPAERPFGKREWLV